MEKILNCWKPFNIFAKLLHQRYFIGPKYACFVTERIWISMKISENYVKRFEGDYPCFGWCRGLITVEETSAKTYTYIIDQVWQNKQDYTYSDVFRPFGRPVYPFGRPNSGAQNNTFQVFFLRCISTKNTLK